MAHCRVNLLTFGTGEAGQYTAWWQRAAGTAYHPWADVVTIIGFPDDLREDWESERLLVEDMLARAVAELGGAARDRRSGRSGTHARDTRAQAAACASGPPSPARPAGSSARISLRSPMRSARMRTLAGAVRSGR